MDYLSIIENAFLDYSDWVSRKSKIQIHMLAGEADLRGIFFNKLVTRLREKGVDIGRVRRSLYPTDFICHFSSPGFMESITLNPDAYSYTHHGPERKAILVGLKEALDQIDMTRLSNRFTWELTKIVNSLKNL